MYKLVLAIILFTSSVTSVFCQSITISPSGLFLPNYSTIERELQNNPEQGRIIWNTTTNGIQFFNGTEWESIIYETSLNNYSNSSSLISNLFVADVNGIKIPSFTQSEIDNISPIFGQVLFNLDTKKVEFYNGQNWYSLVSTPFTFPNITDQNTSSIILNGGIIGSIKNHGSNTVPPGNISYDIGLNKIILSTGLGFESLTSEKDKSVVLRVLTNPSLAGVPTIKEGVYELGEIVNLNVTSANGFKFNGWSGDTSGINNSIFLEMSRNKTVVANFVSQPTFYLDDNETTCKCPFSTVGSKGIINGIEYESVDNTLLRNRFAEGSDMKKLCTSLVTNLDFLFQYSSFNENIESWDVSNVTSMIRTFAYSEFNQPISNWNVSNVKNMNTLFSGAKFNEPINDWDVSNVTDMSFMFYGNKHFQQQIDKWDVRRVTSMQSMFGSSEYNQPIDVWNVENVLNMNSMFSSAKYNQSLGSWALDNVTDMSRMFYNNKHFQQQIDNWNVSNVQYMVSMFESSNFTQPLGNWNVSNVKNMSAMFKRAKFNEHIGDWNVLNVENMNEMFYTSLFNQPINQWNVGNVTSMNKTFYNSNYNQPLNSWNVSNVTNMVGLFADSKYNQPLNSWNVGKVKKMFGMFYYSQFNQPIDQWNVTEVTDMGLMFAYSNFNQDLSNWCVSNFSTIPPNFDDNTPTWVLPKPNWGISCL